MLGLLDWFLPCSSLLEFGESIISLGVVIRCCVIFTFACEVPGGLDPHFLALVVDASYVDLELVAFEFGVFGLAVRPPGLVVGVVPC